jgi:MFS family permease
MTPILKYYRNIVVQLTSARKFAAPPYDWKVHSLGLLSLSGFLGAILAIFFGGPLIDRIANSLTARNRGIREPEYRLPAIVVPAFLGPLGVLIFGLTLAAKTHWIGPAVGYAMQGFGLTAVSNVVVTYSVDSYLPLAGEALVVVFVVRGVVGTVLALWAANWLAAEGLQNAFGEMVAISYFVILFALVFWFWGKNIRACTMRYGPMKRILRENRVMT